MTNRELDKLVAEKVMWLDVYTDTFGPLTKTGKRIYLVNDYSTNIAAAWQVFEKIREAYPDRHIKIECIADSWSVTIGSLGVGGVDTAPMAICLAALHAMGVSIPKEE